MCFFSSQFQVIAIIGFERSFFLFCLFFVVVCLMLLSLVAAAFLANKDVYIINMQSYLS